ELHVSRPAGIAARKAYRGMGSLGAGDREAHQLGAGDQLPDALSQADLALVLTGDGLSVGEGGGDRPNDGGGSMAEDRGAVAQHIVDQDIAVDVVKPRPLAAPEEERRR